MKILGLIPARGGSKGIQGKNIKLLNGTPLVGYTISTARESKLFEKVVVSTDSTEIADISKNLGADVPFMRPASLAGDKSPTIDMMVHAIRFFNEQGEDFDAVCLLQPTVPFRAVSDLKGAVDKFRELGTDSLISVSKVPDKYNPHWTFLADESENILRIATGEKQIISRRQDLPPAYYRDGSVYLTRTEVLLNQHSIYGNSISYYECSHNSGVNIDTAEDWVTAEKYIRDHGS